MGKKRVAKQDGGADEGKGDVVAVRSLKRTITSAVLFVESSYNNTRVTLSDQKGNVLMWSSSGSLGFKGAKKGTPFAASKVGELMAEKAAGFGIKEVRVALRGVGAGREAALRSFIAKGIGLISISDVTPIPHNGPRPPRPRRV